MRGKSSVTFCLVIKCWLKINGIPTVRRVFNDKLIAFLRLEGEGVEIIRFIAYYYGVIQIADALNGSNRDGIFAFEDINAIKSPRNDRTCHLKKKNKRNDDGENEYEAPFRFVGA